MKKRKYQICFQDEKGSIMAFVVMILLCMMLIATASATLARTQWVMARFSRQTSNSYYLARSGAEKVIDSMNKEIAKELPRMMKQASNNAQYEMLTGDHGESGVSYQSDTLEETKGKYVGRSYENLYEVKLKELMYTHIVDKFLISMEYQALSDVKENQPIKIKTNIYHRGSTGVPADLVGTINQLISSIDVGDSDEGSFLVEVIAWAEKGDRTSLTKSRVVGTISLNQLITNEEELLEEYTWGDVAPEALQSAIVSFGDFVIQGNYSATINGDIHVKGTQGQADYINRDFPEPDQSGGIIVSEGGALNVLGNAFAVSNIQTANTHGRETMGATITIANDAIASTIAMNDSYYLGHGSNLEPWENLAQNNRISIGRNAYTDNDIRIDRYVNNGIIDVNGSVFGISDKDLDGQLVGGITVVDPNKSSGIFCLGENSQIIMNRAFVAGQPYINFEDGMGYHRLHESIGEPFEDVYYLEEYRQENGDSSQYMTDFKEMIDRNKIIINEKIALKPYGFAPALVSTTISGSPDEDSYDIKEGTTPMANSNVARSMFYEGSTLFPSNWESGLAANSDWNDDIPGTTAKWGSVIENSYNYFNGENPYNKKLVPTDGTSFDYGNMLGYKGLQGYMLAKRGVFYETFIPTSSVTKYAPTERAFDDLIDMSVFTAAHQWSHNNPIHVVTGSETINISQFEAIPTAIVCTNTEAVITLESGGSTNVFNGIIINAGKTNIASEMTINGVIIAGNEWAPVSLREDIQQGKRAGVQISAQNVMVQHDRNQLLEIRCMDKSLQRKLYDCLNITKYKDASSVDPEAEEARINVIIGPVGERRIKLSPLSVIHSKQGGIQFVLKSLRKL